MTRSNGKRSNTRNNHSRPFRRHGSEHTSTYLQNFKVGDYADIIINSSIHKGLPFKYYHGKTGKIFNISKSSIGIKIEKTVGNRKILKKISVRVEHLKKSKSIIGFSEKKAAKDRIRYEEKSQPRKNFHLRGMTGFPLEKHSVSFENIKTVTPEPYCMII
mmetsp:Transcript_19058/g.38863  ORF Transcript_19058/g.38863 Transcript_19058/m.38863 type:complete len:160 (+) Transcript_19058:675-1154(+)